MKPYRTIDEVLSDRRKGEKLSEVIENILRSPYVLEQIEIPFDVVEGLYPGDYVDASTDVWRHLPVELQIEYASAYQRWYARQLGYPSIESETFLRGSGTISQNLELCLIPPMRYRMGNFMWLAPKDILVKKPFWMGKYAVVGREWEAVMGEPRFPEHQSRGLLKPKEYVNWEQCLEFCKKTDTKLPHERQWELACRAGTTTDYSFGNDDHIRGGKLDEYVWHEGNTQNVGLPNVGQKKANAFGLHDMHGSVVEWCQNKVSTGQPIIRGGCANFDAFYCQSAWRDWNPKDHAGPCKGFRIIKEI